MHAQQEGEEGGKVREGAVGTLWFERLDSAFENTNLVQWLTNANVRKAVLTCVTSSGKEAAKPMKDPKHMM